MTVLGAVDDVALGLESASDERANSRLVLDQKNPHALSPLLSPNGS